MNPQAEELQKKILAEQYDEWKKNPVTTIILSALQKHKDSFVTRIAYTNLSDANANEQLKYYAGNIKNMEAVLQIMTEPEALNNLLFPQPTPTVPTSKTLK